MSCFPRSIQESGIEHAFLLITGVDCIARHLVTQLYEICVPQDEKLVEFEGVSFAQGSFWILEVNQLDFWCKPR